MAALVAIWLVLGWIMEYLRTTIRNLFIYRVGVPSYVIKNLGTGIFYFVCEAFRDSGDENRRQIIAR